MENLHLAFDRSTRIYDKKKIPRARYPDAVHLAKNLFGAVQNAYSTATWAAHPAEPIVLSCERVERDLVRVLKIFKLPDINTFTQRWHQGNSVEEMVQDITESF